MTRTRKSAKAAGTRFETLVAEYLSEHVDDRIERRTRHGAKDRGDISGLRHMAQRVVVECKDVAAMSLSQWSREAEVQRGNDDAVAGVVAHKRRGRAAPADQWVTMTLGDLVALLTGSRDHLEPLP